MPAKLSSLAVLVPLTALVACSQTQAPPSIATPAPRESTADSQAVDVKLPTVTGRAPAGTRRATWRAINPQTSATAVQIVWLESPDAGCGRVATVYLEESKTRVEIALAMESVDPKRNCVDSARSATTRITLASALGTRQLVEP